MAAGQLRDCDLGSKQMQILYRLSESPCSMRELAEYTVSDKATVTRAVETLVQAGWAKRVDGIEDRRKRIIHLTKAGAKKALGAKDVRNFIGEELEKSLTPLERKQFVILTNKIAGSLTREAVK